jgi:nucleotide-binding universal stress UspA family protein
MASTFTRILVPTDFGPESNAAFRSAVSLARAVGASIYLLHVAKDPILAVTTPELYGIDWAELRDDIAKEAHARLTAIAETAKDVSVTCYVPIGRAADTIVQAAEDVNADLIVMGTHGRGGLGHLVLGSVAERVIRMAGCPVMTVRDSGAVRVNARERQVEERQSAGPVIL